MTQQQRPQITPAGVAVSVIMPAALDYIRSSGYGLGMEQEARIIKALADATRLRILALLGTGELCVCEIIAALEMPQSTISRHLAHLKRAGWVQDRRQGNWMYYRLAAKDSNLRNKLQTLLQTALASHPATIEAKDRLETFRRDLSSKGRLIACATDDPLNPTREENHA